MNWAMLGVLLAITLIVALPLILLDRKAGPLRMILTVAAAAGCAWAASAFVAKSVIAGVFVVPAVVGALAGGLLVRALTQRLGPRRRVE